MSILQSKIKKKVLDIPEPKDYDFSQAEDDLKARGLDHVTKSFIKRNEGVFKNLKINAKLENPVAIVASRMESCMSKRELAFLLAKSTLIEMMKQQESENS